MREYYKGVFRKFFDDHLSKTRASLHLTQACAADILQMTDRSYIDMEHGKTACSGLTLALYLIFFCDNPLAFLSDLCNALDITVPYQFSNTIAATDGAVSYRLPLAVKDIKRDPDGKRHAVCPRCGKLLDGTDMPYCEHCGQNLDWNSFAGGPIINSKNS